jgi:pilus assembly protein CpaE
MNEAPLSVLMVANSEPTSDWVQSSLKDMNYKLAGRVEATSQALQMVKRSPIDIILADSMAQGVTELHWIQKLAAESASTMVIVIATSAEMDFVRHAMLTGAQGFLLKPFDLPELHKSIQQVHQLSLQRRAALAGARQGLESGPDGLVKAHTIAVFSPKGGAGATTLAVNLAVALQQQTTLPVLLVDADLRTADVDIFLSIFSKHSVYDLINLNQRLDKEVLDQVVTKHASGITVLRGEPQLQLDIAVGPGQMSTLIEGLSAVWPGFIVINTSDGLDRWTVEVLDAADTVLVVAKPELPVLRATRNFLDLAEAAVDMNGKWQLVMTSYQGQKMLRTADIEASIHYPIKATIAEDIAAVSTSINRGTPLMVSHRKSPIARDVLSLAKQLADSNSRASETRTADGRRSPARPKAAPGSERSDEGSSFLHSLASSIRLPARQGS